MSENWDEDDGWDVQFPDMKPVTQHHETEPQVPRNVRFGRGSANTNSSGTSDHVNYSDAPKETILVPRACVGRIIGRGGSKIRELQEISGANINISRDGDGDHVPVNISGAEANVQKARELIEELNSFAPSQQRENAFSSSNFSENRATRSDSAEKIIEVNSSDCGRIIGRGGSKIKALQEESGARIEIKRQESYDDITPVLVRGDEACVQKAESLINELLEESTFNARPRKRYDTPPMDDSDHETLIDWAQLKIESTEHQRKRWGKLEAIKKNFYIEDNAVADMLPFEVDEWRKDNFNISVSHLAKENSHTVLNPCLTFEHAFKHYPGILDTIYNQNFKKPSPIQSQAWPLALRGYDVIGIAQTGTGKTLAFLLPAFVHIDGQAIPRKDRKGPSCLILTPTRELALQIEMEIKKYVYRDIRCVCVYGGGDRRKQINLVTQGVEIIVATPGRFNDLLANGFVSLDSVTFLVLDEADRMLDMGFEPQIMKILLDIRPDRQTMMTSATWPEGVRRLARSYLTDPMQVSVGSLDLAATHTVTQIVEVVPQADKHERLYDFIATMEKEDKVLVFVGRKVTADNLSADLCMRGISCQSIHGGREQYDREQALDDFKTGYVRILVATDVASRGLDVADITHVFNFDYPRNTEEYVHRVGRTGRAGKSGTAITLVTTDDWNTAKELIEILAEAQQNVPIELQEMADRFARMKERRQREGGFRGNRRGGGFRRDRW